MLWFGCACLGGDRGIDPFLPCYTIWLPSACSDSIAATPNIFLAVTSEALLNQAVERLTTEVVQRQQRPVLEYQPYVPPWLFNPPVLLDIFPFPKPRGRSHNGLPLEFVSRPQRGTRGNWGQHRTLIVTPRLRLSNKIASGYELCVGSAVWGFDNLELVIWMGPISEMAQAELGTRAL